MFLLWLLLPNVTTDVTAVIHIIRINPPARFTVMLVKLRLFDGIMAFLLFMILYCHNRLTPAQVLLFPPFLLITHGWRYTYNYIDEAAALSVLLLVFMDISCCTRYIGLCLKLQL